MQNLCPLLLEAVSERPVFAVGTLVGNSPLWDPKASIGFEQFSKAATSANGLLRPFPQGKRARAAQEFRSAGAWLMPVG